MSRNTMLPMRSWRLISILALLKCALGYVAQLPTVIAQSPQPLPLAISNTTTAISFNGTYTDALQEDAPLAFKVEYFFKAGGATFDRIAFFNTMLVDVGTMTKWPWNTRAGGAVVLPSPYGILMRFVPDRFGPGLRIKHIVWTIEEVFDILVENNRYSVGNIVVNSDWDSGRLAVGSLAISPSSRNLGDITDVSLKDPPSPDLNRTNVSDMLDPPNNMGLDATIQLPDVRPANVNSGQLVAVNETSESSSKLNNDVYIRIRLAYNPSGAAFRDVQVYNATLKLLIKVAATTSSIWPMIATYNDMDDFTLSIRPVSVVELSGDQAAHVLTYLPQDIVHWQELSGVITVDEKPRGIVCIDKGDRTDFLTSLRCEPPGFDEAAGNDGVATA